MLEQITPLLLTFDEAPNIGRTLARLDWARDIVVVDSFSRDDTLKIVAQFPRARVFQRRFDTHRNQWDFGLRETGITAEWVLALDADYLLTPQLIEELESLKPESGVDGYRTRFIYCIDGKPLNGSAYPPVTVLYRRAKAGYRQDGHTQRIEVEGAVRDLQSPILHDDRKSLSHWVEAQSRYMRLEAEKLRARDFGQLGWGDRIRKLRVAAPFFMLLYCLLIKGAVLNGRVGFFYALQRMFSEMLLSLYLLEQDLVLRSPGKAEAPGMSKQNQTEWTG